MTFRERVTLELRNRLGLPKKSTQYIAGWHLPSGTSIAVETRGSGGAVRFFLPAKLLAGKPPAGSERKPPGASANSNVDSLPGLRREDDYYTLRITRDDEFDALLERLALAPKPAVDDPEVFVADVEGRPVVEPDDDQQERLRRLVAVLARPEQAQFRQRLVDRVGPGCQFTGCGVTAAVEAAHLRPVADGGSDRDDNGLLLRRDLHALFDLDLLGVDPKRFIVRVSPELGDTEYQELEGLPLRGADFAPPGRAGLEYRWRRFRGR